MTDGCITAVDRLGTQRGHERRTRYRCHGARWDAEPSEIGFSHGARAGDGRGAVRCSRLLLCGAADEAPGYLSAALAGGLDAAALAAFFGPFTGVRPYRLPEEGGAGRVFGCCPA